MSWDICYEYMWYFFLYAFLGWCCEVCFAAGKSGKFVNRGFLNGPLCPIYGFGVVLVVGLLTPVKDNVFLLFLCSVLLTTALEWLTGFVLEKAFHQKWWDYSRMPFNLNGYVCLLFSLMWGLACLLIMDVIHPMVAGFVAAIPHTLGVVLLAVFTVLALADLAATVATVVGLNKRLRQLEELAAKIHEVSDSLGERLADTTLAVSEKGEALKESAGERRAQREEEQAKLRTAREEALRRREAALAELRSANEALLSTYRFGQKRLLKAFPDMKSVRHSEALEQIKARLTARKNEK
ncbi:putative ABC transporter permease [Pseudoflavonifractor capillosus]|uniref:putative ABC transporter permease n=1 Tax=Pseudoflavonifractor capillosus TaxID=106588 RepID=UPI002A8114F3|nr:hypothetical protein [Pseudoflavonifractor capillosus]MDY4660595.1 hypothetical protein [Pseudoflavonifractor capillosus]